MSQGGLISGGIRSSPQRDRPLDPAVAELPEAAVLEEIAEGIDHRRQDRIEGTGLPSVRPGHLHDGQGIVETAVDGLVVPGVVPEVDRVEEQEAEEPGRVSPRREVRPTLAVVAQRLVEGAEVPLLVAIEKATALQLTDPLNDPGGRVGVALVGLVDRLSRAGVARRPTQEGCEAAPERRPPCGSRRFLDGRPLGRGAGGPYRLGHEVAGREQGEEGQEPAALVADERQAGRQHLRQLRLQVALEPVEGLVQLLPTATGHADGHLDHPGVAGDAAADPAQRPRIWPASLRGGSSRSRATPFVSARRWA